jgi:DNA-binding MarR family transcriptional regulator
VDPPGTEPARHSDAAVQRGSGVRLGPALRRAWVGYQRRLDAAMGDAGFDEHRFPDGRVLRLCSVPGGTTISNIGRELGITRQGASKFVSHLQDRGYVSVAASATSGREKTVTLTAQGAHYLEAHRQAVRTIERHLREELGEEPFSALHRLLDRLDSGDEVRMRTYLSGGTPGQGPRRPQATVSRRR